MRSITVVLLALLLAGCSSQVPIAVNAPLSTQLKAKSTHHWDILADDVAKETFGLLESDPKKAKAFKGKAFYVVAPAAASTFDKAFRDLLITRMVNRGMPVANRKGDSIDVKYETQIVRHNSPRYGHVPGTLTALTGGVWVVREIVEGSLAVAPGGLALTALADWGAGKFANGTTPTELIVTTSIALEDRYVYRKSSIYYIETVDADLYLENPVPETPGAEYGVKRLEVVGK